MRLFVAVVVCVAGFFQPVKAAMITPTIAAIGDSQTSTLSNSFLKHLPPGWNYLDLSISGHLAHQTLDLSFTPALNDGSLAATDAFVIMHGTNDVVFSYEHGAPDNIGPSALFEQNYYPSIEQMVDGALSIGLPVVIVTPPSVHPDWIPPDTWLPWVSSAAVHQARIALAAERLAEMAADKGVAFVDGHAIFGGDGYPAGYFGGDLLHFSSDGHLALANSINPALEAALVTAPVPAALPLFGSALAALFGLAWRRRAKAAA